MKRTAAVIGAIAILEFVTLSATGQNPVGRDLAELSDIDRAWLRTWRTEIDRQFALLTEAYQLDEAQQSRLRGELESRLALEWEHQKASDVEIALLQDEFEKGGSRVDSPEAQRLDARTAVLWTQNPLNEVVVAQSFEATLSPEVAATGRIRLDELWYRRNQRDVVGEQETQYDAGIKKALVESAFGAQAPKTATGDPLPRREELIPLARSIKQEKPVVDAARQPPTLKPQIVEMTAIYAKPRAAALEQEAGASSVDADKIAGVRDDGAATSGSMNSRVAPPSVPAGKPQAIIAKSDATRPQWVTTPNDSRLTLTPAAPATGGRPATSLPPAPELDEWDKYVDQIAGKYRFDDSQRTKGQAVLRDLRKRAEQYRASRSNDYVQARQNTDAKLRAETLKKLNQPIDALFAELKQRLDSLATAQQKAKAAPAEPAKKK